MRERAAATGEDPLRITTQFRVKAGMAYELRERGSRLTLLMTSTQVEGTTDSLWTCEAFVAPQRSVLHAASTRAAALRGAGEAWKAVETEQGLPSFDWDAVAQALARVRAV
jgi:hypothetical protein